MEAATDYTMWALFWRATIVVKIVMIGMILASVWTWGIVVDKVIQYRKARREAAVFDRAFWSGEPLDGLFDQIGQTPTGQSEKIFVAGMLEWRRSHRQDGGLIAGAQSRIDRAMDVAIAREAEALQRGLPVLATVGSTAPFVGLFGTVWGIMHAFIEIAEAQNTSLAVVAPGIAEALLATGLACWRPFRRSCSTTSSVQTRTGLSRDMKPLPMNSRRSCRASWTAEPWARV